MHGLFPYLINAFINLELYRWPVVRKSISACVVFFTFVFKVKQKRWRVPGRDSLLLYSTELKIPHIRVECTSVLCYHHWGFVINAVDADVWNSYTTPNLWAMLIIWLKCCCGCCRLLFWFLWHLPNQSFSSAHIIVFLSTPTYKQTAPWPPGRWGQGGNSGTAVKPQSAFLGLPPWFKHPPIPLPSLSFHSTDTLLDAWVANYFIITS